jgi:formate-dependent nitrite reductase membrane component NrfD
MPDRPPQWVSGSGGRKKGKSGEQPMVPRAEFTSYYGQPVLKAPVWRSPEIPGYLFLGGLAGASSVLAAGAQFTGRPALAVRSKVVAAAAIGLSAVALIRDLGRPSRFYNMLRVLKPTSPMSVGSWLLAAYGPAAVVAAAAGVAGRFRRVGAAATVGAAAVGPVVAAAAGVAGRFRRVGAAATVVAAVLGPAVATYTAALLCDTAIPAWHDGYREMPFLFAGSSAMAAGGVGLITAPLREAAPARRLALIGAAVETVAAQRMDHRMGMVAEPYRADRSLKVARVLLAGGAAMALVGRRNRIASAAAGAALAASSAFTRFGIFEAGRLSAADPKYTVQPQRERVRSRAEAPPVVDRPAGRTT